MFEDNDSQDQSWGFSPKPRQQDQNKPIGSTCNPFLPESWEFTSPNIPIGMKTSSSSHRNTLRGSKQATFLCFPLGKCSALLELTLQRPKPTSISRAFSKEGGNGIGDRHVKTKHNDQTVRHLWVERERGSGGGEKNGFLWAASGAWWLIRLTSGLEMTFKRQRWVSGANC